MLGNFCQVITDSSGATRVPLLENSGTICDATNLPQGILSGTETYQGILDGTVG